MTRTLQRTSARCCPPQAAFCWCLGGKVIAESLASEPNMGAAGANEAGRARTDAFAEHAATRATLQAVGRATGSSPHPVLKRPDRDHRR